MGQSSQLPVSPDRWKVGPSSPERVRGLGGVLRRGAIAATLFSTFGCEAHDPGPDPSFFPMDIPVLIGDSHLVRGEAEGLLLSRVGMLYEFDGDLLVSDPMGARVHVLDTETGEPLGSFGQAGEGPGQLSAPSGLGSDALGRVLVLESGWRVSVFQPMEERGRYRREARFSLGEWVSDQAGTDGASLTQPVPLDDGAGFLWFRSQGWSDARRAPESVFGLVRVSQEGAASLEFEISAFSEEDLDAIDIVWSRDPNRRFGRDPVAGASGMLSALSLDGRLALANPKTYAIDVFDGDGSLRTQIEGPPLPAVHLTDQERERHAEPFQRLIEDPSAGLEMTGDLNPDTKYPVQLLAFARDGDLWVQLSVPEDSPVNLAHVFAPDGDLARIAVWPKEVDLLGRSFRALGADRAWGVALDSFDVPSLVQLRFRTAESAELEDFQTSLSTQGDPGSRYDSADISQAGRPCPVQSPEVTDEAPDSVVVVRGTDARCEVVFTPVQKLTGGVDGTLPRPPVTTAPGGRWLTATYIDGQLAVWSPSGELEQLLGMGSGDGPGEFRRALDLIVDSLAGTVHVLPDSDRMEVYSLDGDYLEGMHLPSPPTWALDWMTVPSPRRVPFRRAAPGSCLSLEIRPSKRARQDEG